MLSQQALSNRLSISPRLKVNFCSKCQDMKSTHNGVLISIQVCLDRVVHLHPLIWPNVGETCGMRGVQHPILQWEQFVGITSTLLKPGGPLALLGFCTPMHILRAQRVTQLLVHLPSATNYGRPLSSVVSGHRHVLVYPSIEMTAYPRGANSPLDSAELRVRSHVLSALGLGPVQLSQRPVCWGRLDLRPTNPQTLNGRAPATCQKLIGEGNLFMALSPRLFWGSDTISFSRLQ